MVKVKRTSINFKLPQDLLDKARTAALERETTLTALVIQGLYRVLDLPESTESDADARLHQLAEDLTHLARGMEALGDAQYEQRLSSVEQKLVAFTSRLEQLERIIVAFASSNSTGKRQSLSPYQRAFQNVELEAFPQENLARRLGVSPTTLQAQTEKLTCEQFKSWTRNRDPRGLGWEYREQENLYYSVK